MKIHQLPMGARFEYEGKEYVKTGPMLGTCEGSQRLFPKYAVLQPLGEHAMANEKKPGAVPREVLLQAFDDFYAECATLVPVPRLARLQEARAKFLRALGE